MVTPPSNNDSDTEGSPYDLIHEISHPSKSKISSISFSLSHLAIGDESGTLLIYDTATWEQIQSSAPLDLGSKIRVVKFSPCYCFLGVGCDDGKVMIIDVRDLDGGDSVCINSINCNIIERSAIMHAISFKPITNGSKDAYEIALGGFDGIVAIASMDNNRVKKEISRLGVILSLDYSPCGNYLAIGASDKCVSIVDTQNYQVLLELKRLNSVQCVQWSLTQDSNEDEDEYFYYLAAGGRDGTAAIYKMLPTSAKPSLKCKLIKEIFPGRKPKRILCLGWNLENTYVVCGGTDENSPVYDITTEDFTLTQELSRGVTTQVTCLAFHEHFLALGGKDCKVFVYKNVLNTSKHVRRASDELNAALSSAASVSSTGENARSGSIHNRRRSSRNSTVSRNSITRRSSLGSVSVDQPLTTSFNMIPRSWSKQKFSQPLKFLQKSDEFLNDDSVNTAITSSSSYFSSMTLISVVTSVRMLRYYLQRIRALEDENNPLVKELSDDIVYLNIFCEGILDVAIKIMEEIACKIRDGDNVNFFSNRFNVGPQDLDLIQGWNEKWKTESSVKSDVPFLDIDLLIAVDNPYSKDIAMDANAFVNDNVSVSGSVDSIEESIATFHNKADYLLKHQQNGKKDKNILLEIKEAESETFLKSSKKFLLPYESGSPASHLRSMVSAVLMLQCHIQFVDKKDDDKITMAKIKKSSKALQIFISLLKIFNEAMEKEMTSPAENLNSILKLKLSKNDFKYITQWNNLFKNGNEEDLFLPLLDVTCLENVLEDLKDELGEGNDEDVLDLNDSFKQNYEGSIAASSDSYGTDERMKSFLSGQLHCAKSPANDDQNTLDTEEKSDFVKDLLWGSEVFEPALLGGDPSITSSIYDESVDDDIPRRRSMTNHYTHSSYRSLPIGKQEDIRRSSFISIPTNFKPRPSASFQRARNISLNDAMRERIMRSQQQQKARLKQQSQARAPKERSIRKKPAIVVSHLPHQHLPR